MFLCVYLPGATNALKEVRHPHGQNHCFSQQLLGIFQISNVIPTDHPGSLVSGGKKKRPNSKPNVKFSLYVNIPVYIGVTWHNISLQWIYQVTVISRAIKSLLLDITSQVTNSFLCLMRKRWLIKRQFFSTQPPVNCCRPTLSSFAFVPLASLNPGRSGLGLAWPRPPGPAPRCCRPGESFLCCFTALLGRLTAIGFLQRHRNTRLKHHTSNNRTHMQVKHQRKQH